MKNNILSFSFLMIAILLLHSVAIGQGAQKPQAPNSSKSAGSQSYGNRNIVSYSLQTLGYEYSINANNTISCGLKIKNYIFSSYHGVKFKPFIRFYLSQSEQIGTYIECNVNAGQYNNTFKYGTNTGPTILIFQTPNESKYSQKRYFNAYGCGISFGRQWISRRHPNRLINWEIIGLNFIPFPDKLRYYMVDGEKEYLFSPSHGTDQQTNWYLPFSPGNAVSSTISYAYRF